MVVVVVPLLWLGHALSTLLVAAPAVAAIVAAGRAVLFAVVESVVGVGALT